MKDSVKGAYADCPNCGNILEYEKGKVEINAKDEKGNLISK
jgi:hypothetical protein